MPLSYVETTATAGQDTVTVSFPYLDRAHVHVTIDDTTLADGDLVWASAGLIDLPEALVGGENVKVWRNTPADNLIYQAQPGGIDHRQVNRSFLQLLYVIQEAYDSAIDARSIAEELLTVLDQVTTLYNAVVSMHAEVVTDYEFISGLLIYYDYNITTPYPPSLHEKLAEWKVPLPAVYNPSDTVFGGRMFDPVLSPVSVLLYKVVFSTDPDTFEETETLTLLGTYTASSESTEFVYTTEDTGLVTFAPGDYLRTVMGGTTDSNITGFSLTSRLRRTA